MNTKYISWCLLQYHDNYLMFVFQTLIHMPLYRRILTNFSHFGLYRESLFFQLELKTQGTRSTGYKNMFMAQLFHTLSVFS